MFNTISSTPDNVIGITVTGELTKEDFDYINTLLEAHKQKYGHIRFYIEMLDFKWPSAGAMWEDLKTGIRYLSDIEKAAFATDKEWMKKMAQAENVIFPGTEIKTFNLDERKDAMKWVA